MSNRKYFKRGLRVAAVRIVRSLYLKLRPAKEFNEQYEGSKDYWETRYKYGGNSGSGSYNNLAEFKAEVINNFCKKYGIKSVVEWGCGDGNQLSYMEYDEYLGLDVSSKAVELCRKKFAGGGGNKCFMLIDDKLQLPKKYDLALSLDVIYHLIEDSVYETYMNNLFSSGEKYICIYSSNFDRAQARHERHRKFTNYVESNFTEFQLFEHIKNRYPYDEQNPAHTSYSDFYFYKRK